MAQDQRAVEAHVEKAKTIREFIQRPKIMEQINAVIVTTLRPERFMRVFFSQMMLTPKILDCSNMSLLSTMIQSAQIGLEPILGRAALIPYGGEVTFQPMYRGHIYLARNTGKVRISSRVIFEKETYRIQYGSEEKIEHEPMLTWENDSDRGDPVGAYSIWTYEDGEQTFTFMPWSEIIEIRNKYSKAWAKKGKDSPWGDRPYEMAKKTVIKNHAKIEPCSIYMDHAVNLDNKVETVGAATGQFLPMPGPQNRDFDPREVQERFLESTHELDKLTEDKAAVRFGDVPKFTEPGGNGGGEEEPPNIEDQFTALMAKELPGYEPKLYLEYAGSQASQGNYPLDKFLDYCIKNPREFAGHFVKWAGPPRKLSKPDKREPTADYAGMYRHKRHSDDPKKGLLGWWQEQEAACLQWPIDELKKVHAKFVHLGYADREIPTTLKAKLREGGKGQGESDPPGAGEDSGGPETGSTRVEIKFTEKARERIANMETDFELTAEGLIEHCKGVWNGRAPSYVEYLQRLVKDDGHFEDALYEYMDLQRSAEGE